MARTDGVREVLEAREWEMLAPYAVKVCESKGRQVPEDEDPYRTAFQRDRDRILHCKAFRRLKRKTQVFLAPVGDHYRTRLTHTLEVAQIARTVARALFLNEDLTEAIALGHDLGHTPFGHAGEAVLNEVFPGGFIHSEQSLRVVDRLEIRRSGRGLNLTHEVRDGIRYHSQGKIILKGERATSPASLEGQIVSVADAIAYINHDIDDGVRAKVIRLEDLPKDAIAVVGRRGSERINHMVTALIEGSDDGVIGIMPNVRDAMNVLRNHLYAEVYPCPAIETEIGKARNLLRQLYLHLLEHPTHEILEGDPEASLERRTVDFVAGMTDDYVVQLYERLLMPAPWKR